MPDKDNSDGGGILSSLLGLGTLVATQIPQIASSGNESRLQEVARGGGAGARAVRQGADDAARNALAVAGSGRGATRGLQLREGLRQAENIRSRGAGQAADVAAREEQSALAQLQAIGSQRNQALGGLGTQLATAASTLGAQAATQAGTPPQDAVKPAQAPLTAQQPLQAQPSPEDLQAQAQNLGLAAPADQASLFRSNFPAEAPQAAPAPQPAAPAPTQPAAPALSPEATQALAVPDPIDDFRRNLASDPTFAGLGPSMQSTVERILMERRRRRGGT